MTDYDFIDPDRPERKREVQRRVEAKEEDVNFEDYPEIRNRALVCSGDVDAEEIVKELEEQDNNTENNNSTTEVNTDKVAAKNSSIVNKVMSFFGEFL